MNLTTIHPTLHHQKSVTNSFILYIPQVWVTVGNFYGIIQYLAEVKRLTTQSE